MSVWIILSWVFVAVLTGINIFLFIKLKGASEQMMKMAFPGARNMNEAVAQMQKMVKGANRGPMGGRAGGAQQAQLQQAMDMLKQMQGQAKKK